MIFSEHYHKTINEIHRAENFKIERELTITEHGKLLKFKGVSIHKEQVFHNIVNYVDDFYIMTEQESMFLLDLQTEQFMFDSLKGTNNLHSIIKEPDIIQVCMRDQFLYEHDIAGFILSVRPELEDILPEYVQDITEEHELYIEMKEIIKKPLRN